MFKNKKNSDPNQGQLSELAVSRVHDGVMIVDFMGNIQLINPAACEMLSVSRDDALGLKYSSVVRLVDRMGIGIDDKYNPIEMSLLDSRVHETKGLDLVVGESNKRIPVSIAVIPADEAGSRLIISFRDISLELEGEAERSEFISTASHEMRTPVASIEGYLGLALNAQTATIDARARQYLDRAHESSQHLGKLFADLLNIAKLEDRQLKVRPTAVEVTEVVRKIVDTAAPAIREKGLQYTFNEKPFEKMRDKRKLTQTFYANIDTDFLREILDNIIENAVKYTPSGFISVSVSGSDGHIMITVSDSGMGIARENLPHIFQKFYRVDNSDTRTIGGTGLGLYIAKQRAEAMGGSIDVKSELGKGSTFSIILPRISAEQYQKQKLAESSPMMVNQQMPPESSGVGETMVTTAERVAPPTQEVSTGNLSPEQIAIVKENFAKNLESDNFKRTVMPSQKV